MKNYARSIEDKKEIIIFSGRMPSGIDDPSLYAFWRVPDGYTDATFSGRLVGEDPVSRCIRMRHVPCVRGCSCNGE